MFHRFYWLFSGLLVVIGVFAVRLVIKAQRRAKLERAASAAAQEAISTPPNIG